MPSIFFIGDNGGPLEIIVDATQTPDQLAAKINQILGASGRSTNSSATFLASESGAADAGSSVAPVDEAEEQRKKDALQRSKEKLEMIRKEKEAEAARVNILKGTFE